MLEETNGRSLSVWMDTSTVPVFPHLPGDWETDVCVIGAGIAGLTTAYLLTRQGRQVTVIDAFGVGAGETGRTTAHFFPPDEWYAGVEESFGRDGAKLVADGFAQATSLVQATVQAEQIACEFERLDGYLFALPGNGFKDLDKEVEAARRAGVEVEKLPRVPGLSFDTGPCVRYANQAQFHPLKYLSGLAQAISNGGGLICGRTRALDIHSTKDWQTVITRHGNIRARSVVVATNTPFNNRVALHTKQAGYRTYVIGLEVPRGTVPRILLWDTGDPYYYLRLETPDPDADREILVVGGADHKVGQDSHPQHRYDEIERWVRERFPMAGAVAYRWSGEVMEPADGLALLGRNPMDEGKVYVITGDSGNGMTHCTLGAILVTDLIMGRHNAWAKLYDPARKTIHGLGDFFSEQANTLAQYGDWLSHGEVHSIQQIPPGEGAVIRDGARKLAVHRDEQGGLHVLSAKCTHLGCVVHWNAGEQSWDCPCHGSRFSVAGEVLHGPAPTPLEAVDVETEAAHLLRHSPEPHSREQGSDREPPF